MRRTLTTFIIIAGALLIGTLLIARAAAAKSFLTHDESISYLAATANQGAFERVTAEISAPVSSLATAADWKRFYQPAAPLAFQQIGTDLAETDIHPPLYFWLLHLWVLLFGVQLWAGPALNILFYLVGGLGLFGLARAALANRAEVTAVVLVWAFSPAVIDLSLQARQYALFGLAAIFFVWLLLRWRETDEPSWWRWLLLALATAVGALAHFHFALFVLAGLLVFLLPLWRRERRRAWLGGAAILCGYILFVLLHPRFYLSILSLAGRQSAEAGQLFSFLNLLSRLYAVIDTFTSFWIYGGIFQVLLFCFTLSLLIWLGLMWLRNPARVKQALGQTDTRGFSIFAYCLLVAGMTIFLYLAFLTPGNGMTPRHMSAIWPFFAFLPVLFTRFLPAAAQSKVLAVICAVVLVSGLIYTQNYVQSSQKVTETVRQLGNSSMILSDGVYRGNWPRLLLHLKDDTPLYAGNQRELLAAPEQWLPALPDGSYYISDTYYGNSTSGQDQIRTLLESQFVVEEAPGSWPSGKVFVLHKRDD